MKKKGIAIGGAALLVVLAVVIVMACRKTEINLAEHVSVSFNGYEGYGDASVAYRDTLLREIAAAVTVKTADENEFIRMIRARDEKGIEKAMAGRKGDADDLLELVDELFEETRLDKQSNLKNGDTVTVRFDFDDDDDAAEFGIKFTGESKQVTVEGLNALKKVNPFEYIDVSFSGISPAGSMRLQKKESGESVMQAVGIRAEKVVAKGTKGTKLSDVQQGHDVTLQGLKIGDTVTVTVLSDKNDKQLREEYASELTETSREFIVDDIAEYVSDAAELENHELFARLKTQTENVLKSFFAKEKKTIAQSGMQYEGYYFLGCKDAGKVTGSPAKYNKLYVVYSATVRTKDKKYNNFAPTKVYFPVGYQNIVKGVDGDITANLNEFDRPGGVTLGYQFIEGFTDLTSMKHALVVTEAVGYTGTSGGNLE